MRYLCRAQKSFELWSRLRGTDLPVPERQAAKELKVLEIRRRADLALHGKSCGFYPRLKKAQVVGREKAKLECKLLEPVLIKNSASDMRISVGLATLKKRRSVIHG